MENHKNNYVNIIVYKCLNSFLIYHHIIPLRILCVKLEFKLRMESWHLENTADRYQIDSYKLVLSSSNQSDRNKNIFTKVNQYISIYM